MSEHEAIEIARRVAEAENWPWDAPVKARRAKRWGFFGAISWTVVTNGDGRSESIVAIAIDDASGEVTNKRHVRLAA